MPLFDTKTLNNDFEGSALLASVLYATPQAKADACARGLERLARAGSLIDAISSSAPVPDDHSLAQPADQVA